MTEKQDGPQMDADEIKKQVGKRLEKYKKLNFLEQYAMFMGTAQVLEFGLKKLLCRKYGYDLEKLERWTLGSTKNALQQCGLRTDFILLLKSVVKYRNHMAHELLVNDAMLKAILGGDSGTLETRELSKGIYELEQLVFLHDLCEEHDAWD